MFRTAHNPLTDVICPRCDVGGDDRNEYIADNRGHSRVFPWVIAGVHGGYRGHVPPWTVAKKTTVNHFYDRGYCHGEITKLHT